MPVNDFRFTLDSGHVRRKPLRLLRANSGRFAVRHAKSATGPTADMFRKERSIDYSRNASHSKTVTWVISADDGCKET